MDYSKLTLSQIADIIVKDWKNIYFGAIPYVHSMTTLESINDSYGADSGRTIVTYFLANAQTWRGEVSREIKRELNKRLKTK